MLQVMMPQTVETSLKFNYTIAFDQTDANGISIKANSVSGTIIDLAGNALDTTAGAVADNASFMVDTTAPTAPTIDVIGSSDNGASPTDNISSISTPQVQVDLSGTGANAGGTVTLLSNGASVGTASLDATAISNGSVTITASDLGGQDTYSLTAKVTDAAGNEGAASQAMKAMCLIQRTRRLLPLLHRHLRLALLYLQVIGTRSRIGQRYHSSHQWVAQAQ